MEDAAREQREYLRKNSQINAFKYTGGIVTVACDNLPAEGILLRSPGQSAAAPEELVRPQPGQLELAEVKIASVGTERPAQ